MLWPKINSYKEFDNEKKFLRLENFPPHPHNVSNGPSLNNIRNVRRNLSVFILTSARQANAFDNQQ